MSSKWNLPRIRLMIEIRGVKLDLLAKALDMKRPTLSNKLRGDYEFSDQEVENIAAALDMTVGELNGVSREGTEEFLRKQLERAQDEVAYCRGLLDRSYKENDDLRDELKKRQGSSLGSRATTGS